MADLLGSFIQDKKDNSPFLSLADGESAVITKLKDIKLITKTGFGGEEKEVLRLKVDVETSKGVREKDFDNGTARFATELQEKGVTVGCGFTLTRTGQQTKTRYVVSAVIGGAAPVVSAPVAPAAEVTPPAE